MAAALMRLRRPREAPDLRPQRDSARADASPSFDEICARYYTPIYSYVYRMVGNPDDAGDVTQDAFLSAYRAYDRLDEKANASAWLYRIATNKSLDLLRRRTRVQRQTAILTDEPAAGSLPTPEEYVERDELAVQVERVLAQMTPRYREALLLKEYMGYSVAEIARVTGRSEPAVKSILFRSREQFRSIYLLERTLARQPRH